MEYSTLVNFALITAEFCLSQFLHLYPLLGSSPALSNTFEPHMVSYLTGDGGGSGTAQFYIIFK